MKTVRVGVTSFSQDVGQEIKVRKQIPHRDYNSTTAENDIGLVLLEHPITFTEYAFLIALDSHPVPEGVAAVVSGWGAAPQLSDRLQFLGVETLSNEECSRRSTRNVSERQICATSREGGEAGSEDSGGPLASDGRLLGVVSRKPRGGAQVYARVSEFIDWIFYNTL